MYIKARHAKNISIGENVDYFSFQPVAVKWNTSGNFPLETVSPVISTTYDTAGPELVISNN